MSMMSFGTCQSSFPDGTAAKSASCLECVGRSKGMHKACEGDGVYAACHEIRALGARARDTGRVGAGCGPTYFLKAAAA